MFRFPCPAAALLRRSWRRNEVSGRHVEPFAPAFLRIPQRWLEFVEAGIREREPNKRKE